MQAHKGFEEIKMRNQVNQLCMGATATMTLFMRQLALASACAMVAQGAIAASVSLNQIVPLTLPNNDTELRLVFSGTPPAPQAYQIEQPLRLVLDFPNTTNALASNQLVIGSKNAKDVSVIDNQERTRLVINLADTGNYSTRIEGNALILKIGSSKSTNSPATASVAAVSTSSSLSAAPITTASDIRNVDFQRSASGEGQVTISLANPSIPVDVQQQGSKILVRFLGTKIPAELRRRLDVNDFATPVSTIDAYNEGGNGLLVIQPQGDFEYMAYQADNKLTINVKPVVKAVAKVKKEEVYTGQKLSLNFQDIDVRSVLQLIADFTNLNLVASDTVGGRITIRLQNVPWDQALDIILKTKGLDKRRTGNVIMVAPTAEIAAREKLEAQATMQVEQLAPLQTEYIQLSYAKAADIETLITSGRNSGGLGNSGGANTLDGNVVGSLLSSRGTVSKDPRTNTLIVQDTAKKIDEIRAMIGRLDVAVKQVMIEARIVRATNNFSKELGVKWGVLSQGVTNNNSLLVGGSDTTLWNLRKPERDSDLGGFKYTIDRPDNLNVDLGVTAAGASRIAFGLISLSDVMLDLELSALQSEGKGEVIATPKVLTGDKQKARVASGTQIPYQNATSSGATSTQFINAELSLEVTPNITPDGRIGMELFINNDTPGLVLPTGQRQIDTNRVATNVLVNDGETVVLGGIFVNETGNTVTKVPFLGDIPYVGNLFKKNVKLDNKQELLIFVTPRLVNDSTAKTPK
jgi:type IV pilus assembly protein PilQ